MHTETVQLDGHIIDSLVLSKVLDIILLNGGLYEISRFDVGSTRTDMTHAEIVIKANSRELLENIVHQVGQHGAARDVEEAHSAPAPSDGVFPDGFYSTTNLDTHVMVGGKWHLVGKTEMDCAIVLTGDGASTVAACKPLHKIAKGDQVVLGDRGVRVTPAARREPGSIFSFMGSEVSSERPKELIIAGLADTMRRAKSEGKKTLFVGGPAIIHTGASDALEGLIRQGWIQVLFAGNALATHDIEKALYGTSLGVEIATGAPTSHGHEHHLRAINVIRSAGSIKDAVDSGILKTGVMKACIDEGVDFLLAGSIRDDGPLPDVVTDAVKAQDRMRELIEGVGIAIMVATTLHSVATGNLLPASVQTICVDSDADTVIKLMDRGTHQAFGLVTDCEFFLKELARQLKAL
ncbi:MAG: TIGR00300 family protein [Chthonomonadales bacterium]